MLILKWRPYQLHNTPLHTAMSFKDWYQESAMILADCYNVSWQLILFLGVFSFPASDLLAWFGNPCPLHKIRCRYKLSPGTFFTLEHSFLMYNSIFMFSIYGYPVICWTKRYSGHKLCTLYITEWFDKWDTFFLP